jgi:hypothetical protein
MKVPQRSLAMERGPTGVARPAAAVGLALLAASLAGCAAETTYGARALSVQGKFDWKTCEELTVMRTNLSDRINTLSELQRRAEREAGGSVIGSLAYGPTLAEARADRRIVDEAIGEKNCPPPK